MGIIRVSRIGYLWGTLRVVWVDDAAGSLSAGGWAREADTTALCPKSGTSSTSASCGGSGSSGGRSGRGGGGSGGGGSWASWSGSCAGSSWSGSWLSATAGEWTRSRNGVSGKWWVVDVDGDTGVRSSIGAWEADGWWVCGAASDDVDLCT